MPVAPLAPYWVLHTALNQGAPALPSGVDYTYVMKILRPGLTIGFALLALIIMSFPTWPLEYGVHTSMSIRWMSMFTIVYFELEPLIAFSAVLLATILFAWRLPGRLATRVPSILYFAASASVLVGIITGAGWNALPAAVLVLLVVCGALANRGRLDGPAEQG